MPVGTGGKWFEDPEAAVAADLGITFLSSAATATYDFNAEDYDALLATLNTHEFYQTALTGTNNDLVIIARAPGTSPLTITFADPSAASASLGVTKSTNAITVSLATNASSAITSTAAQVAAALNSDNDSAPYVYAINAPSNDGTGVVTAMSVQNLADWTGTSPNVTVSLETSVDGTNYFGVSTAFTAVTGVGAGVGRAFGPLAPTCRWKSVMTGSGSLGAAFSIDASGKK